MNSFPQLLMKASGTFGLDSGVGAAIIHAYFGMERLRNTAFVSQIAEGKGAWLG